MGQAKARGTFEERKAQAIAEGRVKEEGVPGKRYVPDGRRHGMTILGSRRQLWPMLGLSAALAASVIPNDKESK